MDYCLSNCFSDGSSSIEIISNMLSVTGTQEGIFLIHVFICPYVCVVKIIICASYNELLIDSFIISIISFFFVTGTAKSTFSPFSGKLLGCYIGKCSGSIRSIVRHPELPLIASCGEATSREACFCPLGMLWFHWAFWIASVTI